MKTCVLCGKEVLIDKFFSRKSCCPVCGGDLHICLNCSFYAETAHNKCREPKAEFQRTRDKANFCDYFRYRDSAGSVPDREKEEALRKLNELFKK